MIKTLRQFPLIYDLATPKQNMRNMYEKFCIYEEQVYNLNLELQCSMKMADFELVIKQGNEGFFYRI